MGKLHYTIDINAPKEKVWQIMLSDQTYRQWTEAFQPGSYFEGSWNEGDAIRFLSEADGGQRGMTSKIARNVPYEFISIEHLGEVVDGKDDTESEEAKLWAGSFENYTFAEHDGVTTVTVDLESPNMPVEFATMFDQQWPVALQKLKELAEHNQL